MVMTGRLAVSDKTSTTQVLQFAGTLDDLRWGTPAPHVLLLKPMNRVLVEQPVQPSQSSIR